MGWEASSIVVWVNLLQEYVGMIFGSEGVVPLLGYDPGYPLDNLLVSESGPTVGLHMIFDNPPGSKAKHPEFVDSLFQPCLQSLQKDLSQKFTPRPSWESTTLPWRHGHKELFCETKFHS